METMRACGKGLRRILPWSIPGSLMSVTYSARPVARSQPSTGGMRLAHVGRYVAHAAVPSTVAGIAGRRDSTASTIFS